MVCRRAGDDRIVEAESGRRRPVGQKIQKGIEAPKIDRRSRWSCLGDYACHSCAVGMAKAFVGSRTEIRVVSLGVMQPDGESPPVPCIFCWFFSDVNHQ